MHVADACSKPVVSVSFDESIAALRTRASSHQGFPVVDGAGRLIGVITRRDFLGATQPQDARAGDRIRRPPVVIFPDSSLREAADQMVRADIGRLPVVSREAPEQVIGFLTRSDLLRAHERRLEQSEIESRA